MKFFLTVALVFPLASSNFAVHAEDTAANRTLALRSDAKVSCEDVQSSHLDIYPSFNEFLFAMGQSMINTGKFSIPQPGMHRDGVPLKHPNPQDVKAYVDINGGKCMLYWCYADDYHQWTKGGLAITACVQDGGFKTANHEEIMSALQEGWTECNGKNPNGPAQGTVDAWKSDNTYRAFHVWRPDWDLHVSALPSNSDYKFNCPADITTKEFPRPNIW